MSEDPDTDNTTVDAEFVHGRASKITWEHLGAVGGSVPTILHQLEGVPEMAPFAEDGKLLVSLIDDFSSGAYRQVPFYSIAIGVAGLLYLIDPVDVIPDFIPKVGYIDDAQVLNVSFEMIQDDLLAYRNWKNR